MDSCTNLHISKALSSPFQLGNIYLIRLFQHGVFADGKCKRRRDNNVHIIKNDDLQLNDCKQQKIYCKSGIISILRIAASVKAHSISGISQKQIHSDHHHFHSSYNCFRCQLSTLHPDQFYACKITGLCDHMLQYISDKFAT